MRSRVSTKSPLDEVTLRYTRLDTRRWTLERAINPHVDSEASEELVLDATEHLAAVRVEHARLTRERRQAETSWLLAQSTAREHVRTACHTLKCLLIQRLNAHLSEAAIASREIERIENEERRGAGI